MKLKLSLLVLLLTVAAYAATTKTLYKTSRISPSVVAISCPGNNGDPTVIENISGVLLISCGKP